MGCLSITASYHPAFCEVTKKSNACQKSLQHCQQNTIQKQRILLREAIYFYYSILEPSLTPKTKQNIDATFDRFNTALREVRGR